MGEREEWERFGHGNNTLRIDQKRGRVGLYLYLRGQSYPSWMLSKCQHPSNIDHLKGGTLLGF
jgi:hypothetical protein